MYAGQDDPYFTKRSAKISEEQTIVARCIVYIFQGRIIPIFTKWAAKITEEYAISHTMPRVKYKKS